MSPVASSLELLARGTSAQAHDAGSGFAACLFRSVSTTLLLAVGVAASCGLAALWALHDFEQEALVIAQNDRTMKKLTESVVRGLESVMLLGSADALDRYAERLKTVSGINDLRVLRTDGREAFRDNRTLASVRSRPGSSELRLHERETRVPVLPASFPHLQRALQEKRPVTYYGTDETGDRVMTVLHPLLNEQQCWRCHGKDHEIRGVLKVTTSIEPVDRAISKTRYRALGVILGALALILGLTHVLIRILMMRRVERINAGMNAIVLGDYSKRVPETDIDEFGEMARSFNRMAENLLASSSQMQEGQDMMSAVLRSAHEGIVIANRNDDIVMANAAAEQTLGKTASQILAGGLDGLLDNSALMQSWRAALGDVADEITYRGKPLQVYVSRIRAPDRQVLGSAILMRDISGEKQLRDEVRRLHFTDEQTGAGNVRYLDHALAHCWSRARASGSSVAVILFSIDTLRELMLARGGVIAEATLVRLVRGIRQTFSKGTPVARMAGDTFAVLAIGLTAEKAAVLADKVLGLVGDAPIGGAELWASAGVAVAPAGADGSAADLVGAAGRALAQAIEVGGACVRVSHAPTASK